MVKHLKSNSYIILSIGTLIVLMLGSSYILTQKKMEETLYHEYTNYSKYIQSKLHIMIENKKKSTLFIALALAQSQTIIKALEKKDKNIINIEYLTKIIDEKSSYKNLWYQVIDTEGKSFYRSWTNSTGDSLLKARPEISQTLQNPQIVSTISTGKFAMSFKTMVPIFNESNKLIGIFEIISHFNSIAKELFKNEKVHALFFVDKKYKKQITKPISKIFIDDYYLTSLDPDKDVITLLQKNGLEYYLDFENDFKIYQESNSLVIPHPIFDINKNHMGFAILFKNVQEIPTTKTKYLQDNIATLMIAAVLIISLIGFLLIVRRHQKEILLQHQKHEEDIVKSTKFLTIGQMAAGITHEINTPLTYIKGTVEMSKHTIQELPSSKTKEFLEEDFNIIYNGIKRISIIVESMKEMSQSTIFEKEKINVYATLITVLRMLHNRAKQISPIYINDKLFVFEESQKEMEHYFAIIHQQRIEQVWTIILNNALDELVKTPKYEDRRIDIKIYTNENKLHIDFLDNAGGISKEILPNIFEPFVSTKSSSGIGIGLNVAKKIIQEHEGTLYAKNIDNQACFSVILDLYTKDD